MSDIISAKKGIYQMYIAYQTTEEKGMLLCFLINLVVLLIRTMIVKLNNQC
jgi:hypothetical protein